MIKRTITLAFLLLYFSGTIAQNIDQTRLHIKTLTSEAFAGRGYVDGGDSIAADYIRSTFKEIGLQAFNEKYYQSFSFPINTFPGNMLVSDKDHTLRAGIDYTVWPASPSYKGKVDIVSVPKSKLKTLKKLKSYSNKKKNRGKALLINESYLEKGISSLAYDRQFIPSISAPVLLFQREKPVIWHVSGANFQISKTLILFSPNSLDDNDKDLKIDIESVLVPHHKTQNVVAFIEGKSKADSFIVFSGHYDHLGKMGSETFYPGANDNASGIAMLMDLANYYSDPQNQPEYSIAFIAFAAEEAGLIGSQFYTEHPLFPLKKIKLLVNLDMVGTGSTGITVVNGGVYEKEFDLLSKINEREQLLENVKKRGAAANSDHYFFHKKGVPSFFIYTTGKEYLKYHVPDDEDEGLPLTDYRDLFSLLTLFVQEL